MAAVSPTGTSNDTPTLQAVINANDDVELAAGGVFNIPQVLEIPSSTRIFTDSNNPAILKRTGSTIRTTCVNGNGIRLENIKFDWNFGGAWKEFHSHISLAPPSGSGITPVNTLGDIWVVGCQFVESTTPGTHSNSDSWCISLSPGVSLQDIGKVRILGNRSDNQVQLVGNGSLNGTWSDVEIAYNQITQGHAAGIGFSSLATTTLGRETTFSNINIHHNFIRNAFNLGIFIGQDNGATADGQVTLSGIKINDNLIELGTESEFPMCVLVRPGTASGYLASVECNRNVFSVQNSKQAGNTPRALQLTGLTTGNTLTFNNNIANGLATNVLSNVALTASGNTYLNGTSWSA